MDSRVRARSFFDCVMEYFLERSRVVALGTTERAVVVCDSSYRKYGRHPGNHLSFCRSKVEVVGAFQ